MSEKIIEIPEELEKAIRYNNLRLFIGAGVSMLAGSPSWGGLADKMLNKAIKDKKINYADKQSFADLDNKQKISIVKDCLKVNCNTEFYQEILQNLDNETGKKVYKNLSKFSNFFITTNYDEWLDTDLENNGSRTPIYNKTYFNENDLDNPNIVIHLHGSLIKPDSMILSTKDYLEHYENNGETVKFLQNLFKIKNVLFIGYGLKELEIIETIIRKSNSEIQESKKHFILQGFYKHQKVLIKSLTDYYDHFNVILIPYYLDEKEHKELIDVIEYITNEIGSIRNKYPVEILADMESLPNKRLVELMKKDEDFERKGFEVILQKENYWEYFDDLQANGFFGIDKNRNFIEKKIDTGIYYTQTFWQALPYLEQVMGYAVKNSQQDLIDKIVPIVKSVIDSDVDNYHTWAAMIRILANKPSVFELEYVEKLLNKAIKKTKFDNILSAREMADKLLPALFSSNQINDIEKAVKVFEISVAIKDTNNVFIEHYWLNELIQKNQTELANKCPKQASNILLSAIEKIFSTKDSYSYLTRPAIEKHEQNNYHDEVAGLLIDTLQEILLTWLDNDEKEATIFVKSLFDNNQTPQITMRLAIYLINAKFDILKDLVKSKKIYQYLDKFGYLHEIYHLIKNHFEKFDVKIKNNIFKEIKNIDKDKEEKRTNTSKIRWLEIIINKGHEKSNELFEQLKNEGYNADDMGDLKDFYSYSSGAMWVGNESAFSEAEILTALQKGELIEKLNNFIEQENRIDAPNIRGTADEISQAVQNYHIEFINKIDYFVAAKPAYQYGLISGFNKLLTNKEGKEDWNEILPKLLGFIEKLVNNFGQIEEENKVSYSPNQIWLETEIARSIESICGNHNKKIDAKHLPTIFEIIQNGLEKLPHLKTDKFDDCLNSAINNARGIMIEALLAYPFMDNRINNKDVTTAVKEIEPILDNEIKKCKNDNYEFSTLIGNHINGLNSDWIEKNIKLIFSEKYENNQLCFLSGFSYSNPRTDIMETLYKNEFFMDSIRACHQLGICINH